MSTVNAGAQSLFKGTDSVVESNESQVLAYLQQGLDGPRESSLLVEEVTCIGDQSVADMADAGKKGSSSVCRELQFVVSVLDPVGLFSVVLVPHIFNTASG